MKVNKENIKNNNFIKYFFIMLCIVLYGNTIAYTPLGKILIYMIPIAFILLLIFRKRDVALFLILFFTFGMDEMSRDIGIAGYYSLKTIYIMGISFTTISLVIIFLYDVLFKKNYQKYFYCKEIIISGLVLIISFFVGIINLNLGINVLEGFMQDIQYFTVLFISIMVGSATKNKENIINIFLASMMAKAVGLAISSTLSTVTGSYGGVIIYSYDTANILLAINIVMVIYIGKFKYKSLILISAISTIIVFSKQISGKDFIAFVLMLIIMMFCFDNLGKHIKKIMYIIIGIFMSFIGYFIAFSYSNSRKNLLFTMKFEQFISIFEGLIKSFSDPMAIYLISESPRLRILEFYNIIFCIKSNLLSLIFGRGIGGTFSDINLHIPFLEGAYSDYAWSYRSFSIVHETFNFVILKMGIIGVLYVAFLVFILLKNQQYVSYEFRVLKICAVICITLLLGVSMKMAMFIGIIIGISVNCEKERLEKIRDE